jgi:hypothetical protein
VGRAGVSGTAQRATGQRPPHPATVGRAGAAGTAQPRGAGEAFAAPPGFLRHAAWRRGEPLPASIQRAVEQRLGGVDLSTVRTHEGPEAASIGALAFTRGEDIYFAQGQYRPETRSGRELLGRQIAYVLQQRQGRVHNPLGAGVAVVIDPVLDAEARAFSAVT